MTSRSDIDQRLMQMVERERTAVLLLMALLVLAVFADIGWQDTASQVSPWDLVLQIAMGVVFVGLLAWELLDTTSFAQRVILSAIAVGTIVTLGRLYIGLFGPGWSGNPDLALPTSIGYIPAITAGLFAFLPRPIAARAGGILLALTIPPFAVYLMTHLDRMDDSPRLLDLFHTLLFINPIVFVLGLITARVHRHVDELSPNDPMTQRDSTAETDFETMTFNRPGITRALQEQVSAARSSGAQLTVALVNVDPTTLNCLSSGEERQRCLRHIAEAMKSRFPASTTTIGRLSWYRFVLICQGQPLAPVADQCATLLDELDRALGDGTTRVAQIGLALYQPGETAARLTRRAEEQLISAAARGGSGIAFNADEAF